jgi:hypothetical protein
MSNPAKSCKCWPRQARPTRLSHHEQSDSPSQTLKGGWYELPNWEAGRSRSTRRGRLSNKSQGQCHGSKKCPARERPHHNKDQGAQCQSTILGKRTQPISKIRYSESERDRRVLPPQLIVNPVNPPKRSRVQGRVPQVIL